MHEKRSCAGRTLAGNGTNLSGSSAPCDPLRSFAPTNEVEGKSYLYKIEPLESKNHCLQRVLQAPAGENRSGTQHQLLLQRFSWSDLVERGLFRKLRTRPFSEDNLRCCYGSSKAKGSRQSDVTCWCHAPDACTVRPRSSSNRPASDVTDLPSIGPISCIC